MEIIWSINIKQPKSLREFIRKRSFDQIVDKIKVAALNNEELDFTKKAGIRQIMTN